MRLLALSRRRLIPSVALGLLVALAVPVVADAAHPLAGKLYTGTGVDRLNNGSAWRTTAALGHERFHFHVSASGRAVLSFRGKFYFYCGANTATVRATTIAVRRTGAFAYRFSAPTRQANGTVSGRTFVSIAGSFARSGQVAHVSYLVVFSPTAHPAHDPYTPAGAFRDGCSSWVKGTARAS